jgi:hypothetical protein
VGMVGEDRERGQRPDAGQRIEPVLISGSS